jgi:hypothetical protein
MYTIYNVPKHLCKLYSFVICWYRAVKITRMLVQGEFFPKVLSSTSNITQSTGDSNTLFSTPLNRRFETWL